MAILNYSTKISAGKTVSEIQEKLGKHGAASVSVDYEQGQPSAVTFTLQMGDRWFNFRLPSNVDGVYQEMYRDKAVPRSLKTKEQAQRVAWRVLKDWIEAQLAILQSGQASMPQLFLPCLVLEGGQTLYKAFEEQSVRLIEEGKSIE